MAQIILIRQNQVLAKHVIAPASEVTIGRHPQNRIVLDHMSVSSRHARIRLLDSGQLVLTDLGSTNGTFVNDQRVSEARLSHQDWVTIGNHMLIVDLYESLSLEATAKMLMAAGSAEADDTDQTVMLDMTAGPASDVSFDTLVFLSGGQGDYELFKSKITIGKNTDADIPINGLWSFLAGSPSAVIFRKGGAYLLDYVEGLLKPRVNGLAVKDNTVLNNGDIIQIGPLKLKINCKSR
jgi:pSer/pThr/pTyr-binding forkhead associated (FHA) protein